MSEADVQVIEWCLTVGKQQGSIDSPPVKELQVVLLEVLNSSEEDYFRLGKPFLGKELGSGEFKRTGNVGHLEKPISGWLDIWNEFCTGSEEGECFLEERSQFALPVVIVDFEFVKSR